MKKSILLLSFLCANYMVAQDSLQVKAAAKTNPVVFIEGFAGYAAGSSKGLVGGASANYQRKNDLLTFRFSNLTRLRHDGNVLFFPFTSK